MPKGGNDLKEAPAPAARFCVRRMRERRIWKRRAFHRTVTMQNEWHAHLLAADKFI
jgi:hypothetical protein